MNKTRIIVLCVVILIFCLGLLLFNVIFNKPIPIVDGLSFGVSPRKTERLFGAYYEKQSNIGDTGKTDYVYKAELLGSDAIITCSFIEDKKLSDVNIQWDNCEDALFQNVYSKLYSYYGKKEHFFVKTEEDDQKGNIRIKMGIDNGVTGVFFTLIKNGTSVMVYCVDNS